MRVCKVDGCGSKHHANGLCSAHNHRMERHGSFDLVRRPNGSGSVSRGYLQIYAKGKLTREHIFVAESVLGRELVNREVVHHVDGNRTNNAHENLVICPDDAYHALIHKRQRAMDACGNPNFERCGFCKKYDDPKNLANASTKGQMPYHKECKSEYNRNYHRNVRNKK